MLAPAPRARAEPRHAGAAYTAGEYERRLLNVPADAPSPTLYRPGRRTGGGYRGRTGIYELVIVDDTMRTMIHDGAAEHDLERYARTHDARHPRRRPRARCSPA